MNRKHLFYTALILGATAALAVAVALTLNFSRGKTSPPPSQAVEAPLLAQAITPTKESKGGPVEGIKVHGHWTIDVRDPDGKLVTHREFENGLTLQGKGGLVKLLGRQITNGAWHVGLANSSGNHPCEFPSSSPGGSATPTPCQILEPSFWAPGVVDSPYFFKTLILSLPDSGGLVLSGNASAARNSTIDMVSTRIYNCPPNNGPQTCATTNTIGQFEFTEKQLAQPVNGVCPEPACAVDVVKGQIIQVTVTISFS